MQNLRLLCILVKLFALAAGLADDSKTVSQESSLLSELLSSYNKMIRPHADRDHVSPLQLKMGLIVRQLVKFDEKKQVITWNVWIKQIWNDSRLKWNTTKYKIEQIVVCPQDLWLPDLYLYNNALELYTGVDHSSKDNVFVDYHGTVTWVSRVILKSTCKFDVRFFPFDKQSCILEFGSWVFSGNQINLTLEKDTGDISLNAPNGEWDILGLPAIRKLAYYACCPEPYPSIIYTLNVQRRSLFYLYSFLGPSVLIIFVSILAFCLPFKYDERVTLLITSLLSIALFFTLIADLTPPDPEGTPLVARFMVAILIEMGIAIMAICVIIDMESSVTRASWIVRKVINTFLAKLFFFRGCRIQVVRVLEADSGGEAENIALGSCSRGVGIEGSEDNARRKKQRGATSSNSNCDDILIEDVSDEDLTDDSKSTKEADKTVTKILDYSPQFKKSIVPLTSIVAAESKDETDSIGIRLERRVISRKMDRVLHVVFLLIMVITFVVFLMIPPELHL